MAESIAVLITKPPYGTEEAFAGLRLSLAMLASGIVGRSSVIMVGEGTLNTVASQTPEAIGMPSNVEAVIDLTDFEGEVYCIKEDLEELVGQVDIIEGVELVSWDEASKLIEEHELVTTF